MVAALELLFPTLWDGLPAVVAVLELHLAALWDGLPAVVAVLELYLAARLAGPSASFEQPWGKSLTAVVTGREILLSLC